MCVQPSWLVDRASPPPGLHQAMLNFWEAPALGLNWIQVQCFLCLWLRGVEAAPPRSGPLLGNPVAHTFWGGVTVQAY